MASSLKWRTGFGWGAVVLLACSAIATVLFTGAARLLPMAAGIVTGAYTVQQYRKWNGRGWRQVHFRAMLAYSGIAENEDAIARQAGQDLDIHRACSRLLLQLYGNDQAPAVDALLSELTSEQGAFLADLVERHAEEVLSGSSLEVRADLMARVRGVRFGPQLVIASAIEARYGGVEASRYAIALVKGETE